MPEWCCAVLCVILQLSSVSQSHTAAVQQLQLELVAAQQHSQALTRQLQDMADSHMQVRKRSHLWGSAAAYAAVMHIFLGLLDDSSAIWAAATDRG
jgi:uncharacterized protein YaaW (UPF0174 family)